MKKLSKTSPDKQFPPLIKVVRLKECASTNDYIKKKIGAPGYESPLLVTAWHQTKGRGRGDRIWHSFPGKGLYSSFLFRFNIDIKINFLSLAAGIAVAESVKYLTGVNINLKWPNDIEYQGKKTGGILIENLMGRNMIDSITGIGLNISSSPGEFPGKLSDSATSILEISGKEIGIEDMNIELSTNLLRWVTILREGRTEAIREKYSEHMKHKIGDEITFHRSSEIIKGLFYGLDRTGGIIIDISDGTRKTFYSGEISTSTGQISG